MINAVLSLAILPLLIIGAINVNAESGFIANTTTTEGIKTSTDPNYNTYESPALGFGIKYLKNMTVSVETDNNSHIIHFLYPPYQHVLQEYNSTHKLPRLFFSRVLVFPATGIFGLPVTLDDQISKILYSWINKIKQIYRVDKILLSMKFLGVLQVDGQIFLYTLFCF